MVAVGPLAQFRPVLRSPLTVFFADEAKDEPNQTDILINAQQFEGLPWRTPIGFSVERGKVVAGRSSPKTFFLAQSAPPPTTMVGGQGDPPSSSHFAVGGGVPVIMGGLPYGDVNLYDIGAPMVLPSIGDPGERWRRTLVQRSNAGYAKQNAAPDIGKVVVGTNADSGVTYVVVQEDMPLTAPGVTLDEIREGMRAAGVDYAISLDGSDSATLVVDGQIYTAAAEPARAYMIPVGIRISE